MHGSKGLFLLALAAGCANPPVDATLGGFVVHVEPDGGQLSITRADGTVLVNTNSGLGDGKQHLAFRQATYTVEQQFGSFLFADDVGTWQEVGDFGTPTVGADRISFDLQGVDGGRGEIALAGEGHLTLVFSAAGVNRASFAYAVPDGEHFLGLGAHTQDLDHRGATVQSWVSEQGIGQTDSELPSGAWFLQGTRHQTYFPVPFYLTSRYGMELDSERRAIFELGSVKPNVVRIEAWDDKVALSLWDGATLPEVLERRTAAIGRPQLPPDWAFGVWNDALFDSSNVRRVAGVLRANHIPSDAIWSEDWAGGEQVGDSYGLPYEWKVDRVRYPDLEALASELHAQGFSFLGYFNTFVENDVSHFAETRDKGYLVQREDGTPYSFQSARFQPAYLLDLSNPGARQYLGDRMKAAFDLGLDGWMSDYAEWLPTDSKIASGEAGVDAHNRYPVDWQRLNEEVISSRPDGDQLLSFVRSGYARSAAVKHQVVWGGDQLVRFGDGDGLASVTPLALGLGLSGLPYFGSDVGGYTNVDGTPPRDKELFFRWTTVGAFSVLMRTHHGGWPQKNWDFERDPESLAHFARWARVHTRLFPYLKALAKRAVATGLPIMRALPLAFPGDEEAYREINELLLGPALLVAPIVTQGATSRSVHFPQGRWIPIGFDADGTPTRTVETVASIGQRRDVQAAVGEIPVYLRAGSMVPMLPPGIETLRTVTDGSGVIGLAQLGPTRQLVVALGAAPVGDAGRIEDDLGGSYVLAKADAPASGVTYSFGGAALPGACAAGESCVVSGAGLDQARLVLVGDGALEVLSGGAAVARLEISGRPAGSSVEVTLVW